MCSSTGMTSGRAKQHPNARTVQSFGPANAGTMTRLNPVKSATITNATRDAARALSRARSTMGHGTGLGDDPHGTGAGGGTTGTGG